MAVSKREQRNKPSEPSESFSLTAHNTGQWCNKIRGKIHFLGVWDDPQAALEDYLRAAADLHAGRRPQASSLGGEGVAVKDVCSHFLTMRRKRPLSFSDNDRAETGDKGFEPLLTDPESVVLPLH